MKSRLNDKFEKFKHFKKVFRHYCGLSFILAVATFEPEPFFLPLTHRTQKKPFYRVYLERIIKIKCSHGLIKIKLLALRTS